MDEEPSFTGNAEFERKKQNIADRSYRLTMISTVISIATAVAGAAMMFMLPGMGLEMLGMAIGLGGPILTTMFTAKEQEKLKLDREFLESQFQGGNWGKGHWQGYREEVAEHGYAGPQAPGAFGGPPPYQNTQRRLSRNAGLA